MAQQSIEEITGSNNAALVIPYEMMKARNDTLNRFNAITGLNVVCKLSKSWEREEDEAEQTVYQLQPEQPQLEEKPEESADDTETPTEEAAPDEVDEGAVTEEDKETVAEEIAEQADEGLTIEEEANTLPIDEETGRRIIPDEYNDTGSISDEGDASDPS
jgi:hypothetical protein